MDLITFYIFAGIAILTSLLVVAQKNTMYSVMLLIASFGALAGLYVLLDAPFTAVTQIIIYAGAIVVLFLFVVMLLNVPREEPEVAGIAGALGSGGLKIGAVLSLLLVLEVAWGLSRIGLAWFSPEHAADVSSVTAIGSALFTRYAFAFEVTSILILVSMVGAVVVARRER
jgi:NADH-quinone oxidoreductase subunit J